MPYPITRKSFASFSFLALTFFTTWGLSQELSGPDQLKSAIDQAAKHFKQKDLTNAAEQINLANKLLSEQFDKKMSAADFDKIKQMYPRLKKAHELLSEKNVEVDKLVALPSKLPSGNGAGKTANSKVSFTKQVAPLLIQNCGGCHIQNTRGQVNFTNFQQLLDSPKRLVGGSDPSQSSLFISIDTNKMPPKKPLSDKDKKLIKQWIEEGAEFDGKDKQQLMSNYRKK